MAVKKNLPVLPKKSNTTTTAVTKPAVTGSKFAPVAHDGGGTVTNITPVQKPAVTGSQFAPVAYYADAGVASPNKAPMTTPTVVPPAVEPPVPVTGGGNSGSTGGGGGKNAGGGVEYAAPTFSVNYSPFQQSGAVAQALAMTNELLAQLTSGKTSYTDQIASLLREYQNREAFAYNPDEDLMFQNMLASAMRGGQTAMMDTMGQAAALTGGYGSTYSQAVGNQAYNQYIQGAYDTLPDYYQMAFDAYNREGDAMLNQIDMLNDADATEYERMYNAYTQNYANAMNLYNQEYAQWENEQTQRLNEAEMAYRYAALAQEQAQFEASLAQEKAQYEAKLAQEQAQYEADQQRYSAERAQAQAQFDAEMAYKNASLSAKNNNDNTVELKTPSVSQYETALAKYANGADEYNAYLAALEGSGVNVDKVTQYVSDHRKQSNSFWESWFN